MTYCVHCGLPPDPGCSGHVQTIQRKKTGPVRVERDPKNEQGIHPRVRNGRTVYSKANTAKPKRGK